ncbi:hypothetical protein EG14_09795 [Porphyromonas gingivalis]|nr:hypothetical protein EG14_09795 [Porphyromonas gingivalis]
MFFFRKIQLFIPKENTITQKAKTNGHAICDKWIAKRGNPTMPISIEAIANLSAALVLLILLTKKCIDTL